MTRLRFSSFGGRARELLSLIWKLPLAIVLGILLWLLQLVHWGSGELIKLIGDPWEKLAGPGEGGRHG